MQKSVLGKGLASLLPGAAQPSGATSTQVAPTSTQKEAISQTHSANAVANGASHGAGAVSAGPAIPVEVANKDRQMGISMVAIDEIQINPFQPRREFDENHLKELADSIRANGLIQPLVVRRTSSGYQLIAGERRLRASKIAGLKQIPIVIRRSTDRESLEIALIENIQRQDLNCIDEALAYFQLLQEFSLTQEEIATQVGKERATIANFLRLLKLPEEIIEDLKKGSLSLGHGKVLLSLEEHDLKMRLRSEILEKTMSVRQTEVRAQEMKAAASISAEAAASGHAPQEPATPLATRLANLSQELTRQLSAKVEVKGGEKKGKIVIHYGSRDEFERLLTAFHR